jgi:hypothetical protein
MVKEPDALEIPMFFGKSALHGVTQNHHIHLLALGFVGLFDLFLLSPLLIIWHYTGFELFQWPPNSNVWTLMLVNGFVGTVLSELLWLWYVIRQQ